MNGVINLQLLTALESWITPELAARTMIAIANTPAPSQTPAWTRGPVITSLLKNWEVLSRPNVQWTANFQGTGNGVIALGPHAKKTIWVLAHWDDISYLIGPREGDKFALTPFHFHTMDDGTMPGLVLGYDVQSDTYEVVGRGTIVGGKQPWFIPQGDLHLRPGWRVVFDDPARDLGDGIFSGQMDNAAGCAGILLAAAFLSQFDDINAIICFTDEEEGPVAVGNTAFSRGSRRLIDLYPTPDIAIVADSQTVKPGELGPQMGDGALIREYASQARGGVTPPWLYERIRDLSLTIKPHVLLHENIYGGLGRSDCISVMQKTPNVVLCGTAVTGRHYRNQEGYCCSAVDVAHLARSIVVISLCTHFGWRIPPLSNQKQSLTAEARHRRADEV